MTRLAPSRCVPLRSACSRWAIQSEAPLEVGIDAGQAALTQPKQEVAPARTGLTVGELDREDAVAAVPVDADRQQHGLAADHPGLAARPGARIKAIAVSVSRVRQ